MKEKITQLNTRERAVLLVGLTAVLLMASFVPVFRFEGAPAAFTLFDFIAPIMGALFALPVALVAVLSVSMVSTLLSGSITLLAVLRLLPVLFGVVYFARQRRASALVGLAAMVLFAVHPVGSQAWAYSLFWLIPALVQFTFPKNVFARALGATFTQHAVGGVIFLYAYGMTAEFWMNLIPVVIRERLFMAGGIALAFIGVQALIRVASKRYDLSRWIAQSKSLVRLG